jgi:hypothetical protein
MTHLALHFRQSVQALQNGVRVLMNITTRATHTNEADFLGGAWAIGSADPGMRASRDCMHLKALICPAASSSALHASKTLDLSIGQPTCMDETEQDSDVDQSPQFVP